jgi:hypothetical protein
LVVEKLHFLEVHATPVPNPSSKNKCVPMDDVSSLLRVIDTRNGSRNLFGKVSAGAAAIKPPQSLFFIPLIDKEGCILHTSLMG